MMSPFLLLATLCVATPTVAGSEQTTNFRQTDNMRLRAEENLASAFTEVAASCQNDFEMLCELHMEPVVPSPLNWVEVDVAEVVEVVEIVEVVELVEVENIEVIEMDESLGEEWLSFLNFMWSYSGSGTLGLDEPERLSQDEAAALEWEEGGFWDDYIEERTEGDDLNSSGRLKWEEGGFWDDDPIIIEERTEGDDQNSSGRLKWEEGGFWDDGPIIIEERTEGDDLNSSGRLKWEEGGVWEDTFWEEPTAAALRPATSESASSEMDVIEIVDSVDIDTLEESEGSRPAVVLEKLESWGNEAKDIFRDIFGSSSDSSSSDSSSSDTINGDNNRPSSRHILWLGSSSDSSSSSSDNNLEPLQADLVSIDVARMCIQQNFVSFAPTCQAALMDLREAQLEVDRSQRMLLSPRLPPMAFACLMAGLAVMALMATCGRGDSTDNDDDNEKECYGDGGVLYVPLAASAPEEEEGGGGVGGGYLAPLVSETEAPSAVVVAMPIVGDK